MSVKVKFICVRMDRFCPWFAMHHASLEEYCARHGYQYVKDLDWIEQAAACGYVRQGPRGMEEVQERILGGRRLMVEQLCDCDLLVWLGGDTVVTNMMIRLEDVMPAAAHVAMAKEETYENDAVIVRNSPQGRSLLEDWIAWMTNPQHPVWMNYGSFVPPYATKLNHRTHGEHGEWMHWQLWHDAAVLTAVCERYPEQAARIHTWFRKGFAVKHVHWEKGDYIMHTPGSPDADRYSYLKMGMENTVR